MNKNEYPQLIPCADIGEWVQINEHELDCIFAETGADRELDFDRERAEQELYDRLHNI